LFQIHMYIIPRHFSNNTKMLTGNYNHGIVLV
jgi:hypothetical protein